MTIMDYGKRVFTALGPDNPLVRLALRQACGRHKVRLTYSADCIDVVKGQCAIRISKSHMPYVLDMAKYFEDYFDQVVPSVVDGVAVVDYSGPRLHRYKASGLEFELTSIAEEISAIEAYFRWYRPKAGDVVFDVGAYCGVSTYYFSKLVQESGHVYAFEPDPGNFRVLLRNLDRHQLGNVTPVPLGIAGSSGPTTFNCEGSLGSTISRNASRPSAGRIASIETITFEEACSRYGVPIFAKVDIEGSEIEMLSVAQKFLKSRSINFVLDTNHYQKGSLTNSAVEHIFRESGYEAESSAAFGFMTTWGRKADQQ